MSVDEAWGLRQGELKRWARNREKILAEIERKLKDHNNSPVSYLEAKYSGVEAKEKYARALWQEFPPMDTNPPELGSQSVLERGKPVGSLTAQMCVSCTCLGSPSRVRPWCANLLLTRS